MERVAPATRLVVFGPERAEGTAPFVESDGGSGMGQLIGTDGEEDYPRVDCSRSDSSSDDDDDMHDWWKNVHRCKRCDELPQRSSDYYMEKSDYEEQKSLYKPIGPAYVADTPLGVC